MQPRTTSGAWISILCGTAILAYAVLYAGVPLAQAHGDYLEPARICILLISALGILHWLLVLRPSTTRSPGSQLILPLVLVPAYGLFQVLPLPLPLVRILSPARAHLVDLLDTVLPKPFWVPLSVTPSNTMFHVLMLTSCVVLLLVMYSSGLRLAGRPWSVAVPLIVLGTIEAIIGMLQASQHSGTVAVGTFRVRNHFAGFLAMILPLATLYPISILTRKMLHRRNEGPPMGPMLMAGAGFIAAALILMAILDSLSRMGFVACLASMMFVALVALSRGRSVKQIALLGAFVLGVAVLVLVLLPSSDLVNRFAKADPVERSIVWRDTMHLIASYPVFGVGLGGYQSAFLLYKRSNPTLDQDYAHNDYMQYLAELGLIGFSIGLWAVGIIYLRLKRVWEQPYRRDASWLALACGGAALAIGIHSFVDFNLYVPANMFLLAWILGIAAYTGAINWR